MTDEKNSKTSESVTVYRNSKSGQFLADEGTNTSVGECIFDRPRITIGRPKRADIQNAIYAHIRAMRALGRTRINTLEIAKALSLSVSDVNRELAELGKKGVKIA